MNSLKRLVKSARNLNEGGVYIPHTVEYARTNVIGSRTLFFVASVRHSIH
jgi:hypothetical protein